jgi:hypothetical protein
MLTPLGHTFTITARGQKWSGTWKIEGKEVCVSSAFGSARAPKGRREPGDVAAKALLGLVDDWAARR